jgi:hypothetical protein
MNRSKYGSTIRSSQSTVSASLYSTPSSNTIASTQIITYATLNQTIGLFPNAQGGLENMTNERSRAATPVDIVPLYLATTGANFWNNRNSSTFPKINSGGNTGNKYITFHQRVQRNICYHLVPILLHQVLPMLFSIFIDLVMHTLL